MSSYQIINGDALIELPKLVERGVVFDACITDLPFGSTRNVWDVIIPFAPMWESIKRLVRGASVFFGTQPFTSLLVASNLSMFRWEDIWFKSNATGHLNCKVMPLRQHENILVFGGDRIAFNPQMSRKDAQTVRKAIDYAPTSSYGGYGEAAARTVPIDEAYPRSIVQFSTAYHAREAGLHPNQKPVELMRYLVRTYTNEGDTVLDFAAGSFTTGVACVIENRNFVGIEQDESYCRIGEARLKRASGEWAEIPRLNRKPFAPAPLFDI